MYKSTPSRGTIRLSSALAPGTKMVSGPHGLVYVAPTPKEAARMRRQGYSRVITPETAQKWFPGLFGEDS
jgi:hypothetical protein